MGITDDVQRAISAFSAISGLRVSPGGEAAEGTCVNLTGIGHAPLCVLKPELQCQLDEIVHCANEHRIAIYPVSRGYNWGLGSRSPLREQCALVDLSALRSIRDFSPATGTVGIEPGVTFRQLAGFLADKGPHWQAPVIGGPADASVLANALERGDGVGRAGQREQSLLSVEAVLGNGDRISSDHPSIANGAIDWHSQPPGPSIKSLFVQSNLGVVSSARLQLIPRAADTQFAMMALGAEDEWAAFFDACRALIYERLIDPQAVSIWNSAKRRASAGDRNLEQDIRNNPQSLTEWAASFFFQSWDANLMPYKIRMVGSLLGELMEKMDTFSDRDEKGRQLPSLATGWPSDDNLASVYSAMPSLPARPAPERDGAGCLWLCGAVPLDVKQTLPLLRALQHTMLESGINPNIGMQLVDHRSAHLYCSINFDRRNAEQQSRAYRCHAALRDLLLERGMPLVRLGIQSMDYMQQLSEPTRRWLSALKVAADPNGIIAPGRYITDD